MMLLPVFFDSPSHLPPPRTPLAAGVVQGTSGCTPSKELQRKVLYGKRRRHLGRKDARVI